MPEETGFAEVEQAIRRSVVVPVIRTSTAEEALAVAGWALDQRLPALELTATIPGWVDALRELADSAVVGVGTLRTADDARRVRRRRPLPRQPGAGPRRRAGGRSSPAWATTTTARRCSRRGAPRGSTPA